MIIKVTCLLLIFNPFPVALLQYNIFYCQVCIKIYKADEINVTTRCLYRYNN